MVFHTIPLPLPPFTAAAAHADDLGPLVDPSDPTAGQLVPGQIV